MNKFWHFSPWLSRFILLLPTLIFIMLAWKFISDPVRSAAESGITLGPGVGMTNMRVGFGAFPLGIAIIILLCLISRPWLLMGLGLVTTIAGVALTVRVLGMLADHTTTESLKLVGAETVLFTLSVVGLSIELGRRRFLHELGSENTRTGQLG